MKIPNQNLQDRSFIWGFLLFILLFSASAIWGGKVGLSKNFCLVLLVISGFIPFSIQFLIGYAFDGMWVARYSRLKYPVRYWISIGLSAAIAILFSTLAYHLFTIGK
jgi:hypothetical protein